MRKRKPRPPLATEIETVADALGVKAGHVTIEMLRGLVAGLEHTTSPLKDAAEHLLTIRETMEWQRVIIEELLELVADELKESGSASCLEPLRDRSKEWRVLLDDLQETIFLLM